MTMCNLFERRGGAVFNVTDNIISGEKFREGAGSDTAIGLALEGLAVLHQMDLQKAAGGGENWHPSLWQA